MTYTIILAYINHPKKVIVIFSSWSDVFRISAVAFCKCFRCRRGLEVMEAALDSISLSPVALPFVFCREEGSKHSWRGGVQRRTMLARLELQTHQTKRGFLRDRRRWPEDSDQADHVSGDTEGAASGALLMRHANLKYPNQGRAQIQARG